ncbi:MAG: ribonuclease P protein component [Alistipes sp.]
MTQYSLPHSERLRSLGAIRRMFDNGQSGFVYPFRYVWYAEADEVGSVEVLFSVPKKFHKRANKRNLLRRRTKEAYRLRKQALHAAAANANLDMALIYSTKEVLPYKTIENALRKIMEQIAERM